MMTPNQLEERFKELTFELLFHKYMYFEHDRPLISDRLYDSLKDQYIKIGQQLGFCTTEKSPCLGFSHGHPLAQQVAYSAKKYLGYL